MKNLQDLSSNEFKVCSFEESEQLAENILNRYKFFLLYGPVGSGKSEFVKNCLKKLGLTYAGSPTFGLVHAYPEGIVHVDLYRINSDKLFAIELLNDYINDPALRAIFIEWPINNLENLFPIDKTVKIFFNGLC